MITLRTKALLFLVAICGVGIGVLSPLADGFYSAASLFCFPFLVAFAALAIGIDLNKAPAAQVEREVRERSTQKAVVLRMPWVTSHAAQVEREVRERPTQKAVVLRMPWVTSQKV